LTMKISEKQIRRLIRSRLVLELKQREKIDPGTGRGTGTGSGSGKQPDTVSQGTWSGTSGGGKGNVGQPEKTRGSLVFNMEPGDSPRLLYIYPGTGYGTQGFVARKIRGDVKKEPDTIIVIAPDNNTDWDQLESAGKIALGDKTPSRIRLVGWSGGAQGIAKAIASGVGKFDRIWYADPSPAALVGKDHSKSIMYYRPENWKGKYKHLGPKQEKDLAPEMGDKAVLVPDNHNEILIKSIREALG